MEKSGELKVGRMSGAVETELRKLEKIVPGVEQAEEQMEMVSGTLNLSFF